jgi:hypothetical protein
MTAADDKLLTQAEQEKLYLQLCQSEASNVGAYDKVVLTLAGAVLALSLTFSKDLVPFSQASGLWLLKASWYLLVATLALNVAGFMTALGYSRSHKAAVSLGKQTKISLKGRMDASDLKVFVLNMTQGVLFLLGMLAFVVYVSVNIQGGVGMATNDKTDRQVNDLVKKAQPSGAVLVVPSSLVVPAEQTTGSTPPAEKPADRPADKSE